VKIIGRTADGALVEASDEELARIVGFDDVSHKEVDKFTSNPIGSSGYRWQRQFIVGMEIKVSPMWDWMKKARESFSKIKQSAELVRATAAILEQAPPAALVQPSEEPNG
jgi:hypothetical protein